MESWCSVTDSEGQTYCRDWYIYVLPSLLVYAIGLLILLAFAAVSWCNAKYECFSLPKRRYFVVSKLHDFAHGHSTAGRYVMFAIFLLSLTSFAFYLLDVARLDAAKRKVGPLKEPYSNDTSTVRVLQVVDSCLNLVFAAHFVLRSISASNKLLFWTSWKTIVDVATLSSCLTFLVHKRFWTGLRFLRAWYIYFIPDILEIGGAVRDARAIRLVRILFSFLTLWLVAAGFVHMFENNGDPWMTTFNGQSLSYFECIYFLVITSSTVGYGDIHCTTTLGRIFTVVFVFLGLAMFANILPEVKTITDFLSTYNGRLRLPIGRKHVVVMGHITAESAGNFIDAFLHPDRKSKNLAVAFLNPDLPNVNLEGLLKRRKNVHYFIGNEMDASDLERVKMENADACIILANELAHDPDEEDSANIMRAIAVKNYSGLTRVLIQLIRERNKSHLLNIPSWNKEMDGVVCLEEFKMGTMAQNCWAPGFATLMSLLLTAYSAETESTGDLNDLDSVYIRGAGLEIYGSLFSSDFVGMPFTEAVEVCFKRLHLVLFAIKTSTARSDDEPALLHKLSLNPGRQYILRMGDQGFFLAHSSEDAARAMLYCRKCHADGLIGQVLSRCNCLTKQEKYNELGAELVQVIQCQAERVQTNYRLLSLLNSVKNSEADVDADAQDELDSGFKNCDSPVSGPLGEVALKSRLTCRRRTLVCNEDVLEKFDFTGMFYWRARKSIGEVEISLREAIEKDFHNHVIVCVFAEPDSPQIGLRNFVMPLRSSNHHPSELHPIIIVGNEGYVNSEWDQIENFPSIYFVSRKTIDRDVLRKLNVNQCKMCVILSAKSPMSNEALIDKYAILCYLNIKSMRFSGGRESTMSHSSPVDLHMHGSVVTADTRTPTAPRRIGEQRELLKSSRMVSAVPKIVNNVPVMTEIAIPKNILILDDDMSHNTKTPHVKLHPFACGTTFAGDVLNSAISVAFYNPDALTLIRELVTGGSTSEADEIFAEGLGFWEGTDSETIKANRNRARIYQFALSNQRYQQFLTEEITYAELFVAVLRRFGYVCLGVCRIRGDEAVEQRIVLVSPPDQFRLKPSDKIICLQPFEAR